VNREYYFASDILTITLQIYIVPLKGSSKPVELTKGKHGATSSPVFSNDGKKVAWLQMDRDSFEADRRKIHVASISEGSESQIYAEDWHLSPSSIAFAIDDKSLVGIVEKEEQEVLFEVDLEKKSSAPKLLSHYGGIGSLQVMKHGILISASSLRGPTDLYLVSPHASENAQFKTKARRLTNFAESEGSSLAGIELGPHPEQFQYPGHKGRTAYGWIHYPPSYDASKTYALVVGIHGGPEGCWSNSWSTRWNPAVFTAQDFIMITLDPAGSTSFGQDYQEEILHNWGGAPYHDIIAGTRHILQRFPNIDPERVVAAGAS
jgi:dipeptidyl aminopeptidase/acylaminoacyl peptidase